ncbi:unnamed protein product [Phaeothamnion confervicola]
MSRTRSTTAARSWMPRWWTVPGRLREPRGLQPQDKGAQGRGRFSATDVLPSAVVAEAGAASGDHGQLGPDRLGVAFVKAFPRTSSRALSSPDWPNFTANRSPDQESTGPTAASRALAYWRSRSRSWRPRTSWSRTGRCRSLLSK